MRSTSLFTIVLVVFTLTLGNSQNFKFRKVSKEEVMEKEHPLEKDAEAAYLYHYRSSYYTFQGDGIQLTTDIHQRVKIYTDEGFPYAEFEIGLYDGGNGSERLVGLKAYTYNIENGKLQEYKLDKDDVFKEEINEYRTKVSFTMPNVKEGSVVEVRYKVNSTYYFSIDPFRFQYGIPVNKLEAKFSAPKSFTFNMRNKGYYFVNPKVESKQNPHTQTVDRTYTYNESDIPSLKAEPFVDNIENYRAGVNFELSKIEIPGSYYKSFTQTWEDVTKFIYESGLETELKKEGYFREDLDPVLQEYSGQGERIAAVFEFVKARMNWDETYGYSVRNGVRKAYKETTGNVADINLMLIAMLRYAGFMANPILVSTKSHGIPIFPTSDGFNYVVAAVELDGQLVLLDATSKLAVPNIMPYRVLNWNGRLIREDGSSVSVDLSPSKKAKNMINLSVQVNEDGSVKGRVRKQYTHHRAYGFRNENVNMIEEEYLQELENEYSGIEIENYEIENLKNPYQPVVENFEFYKDEGVEQISGKMFLEPLMFFTTTEHPFKSEKREYPVDFLFPQTDSYMVNYMLPQGYQVESLPESTKFVLPDNLGSFLYQIVNRGNVLQLRVNTDLNTDVVSSEYYEHLRTFFREMIKKEAEKIVIIKA